MFSFWTLNFVREQNLNLITSIMSLKALYEQC